MNVKYVHTTVCPRSVNLDTAGLWRTTLSAMRRYHIVCERIRLQRVIVWQVPSSHLKLRSPKSTKRTQI